MKKCGTGILPVVLLPLRSLTGDTSLFTGWKPVPHKRTKFLNRLLAVGPTFQSVFMTTTCYWLAESLADDRSNPILLILDANVVGLMPKSSAAPPGP